MFRKNNKLLPKAYNDANYAGSVVNRRSTTCLRIFPRSNLVTWRSKKQNVITKSSAKSEFLTMEQKLSELLWIKIILENFRIKWENPMCLYCNNNSTMSIGHNLVQHDWTKHIESDRHFIKKKNFETA